MPKKPVTIDGITYESRAAAARALGLCPSTICNHVIKGSLDRAGKRGGKPVTIRGVTYPTMPKAAEALGVTVDAIYAAKLKGTLDKVGTGRLSVTIDGVTYPTVSQASRETGVSYWILRMIAYEQREKKAA